MRFLRRLKTYLQGMLLFLRFYAVFRAFSHLGNTRAITRGSSGFSLCLYIVNIKTIFD